MPEAAIDEPIADEAELIADDAASIAAVAAVEADIAADEASIAGAGVTTVVVLEVDGVIGVTVASSFLLQAAKETTATMETINSAFFILVLNLKFNNYRQSRDPFLDLSLKRTLARDRAERIPSFKDKESSSVSSA